MVTDRRGVGAVRGRSRTSGHANVVPGPRHGDDRVPCPRRRRARHAADRAARPHRDVPRPGQPPRAARVLPPGADLPPLRCVGGRVAGGGRGDRRRGSGGRCARDPSHGWRAPAVGRRGRPARGDPDLRLRPGGSAVESVPTAPALVRHSDRRVGGGRRRQRRAVGRDAGGNAVRPDPSAVCGSGGIDRGRCDAGCRMALVARRAGQRRSVADRPEPGHRRRGGRRVLDSRGDRRAVRFAEPVDDHRLLPPSARGLDRRTGRARRAVATSRRHPLRGSRRLGLGHLRGGGHPGPAVARSRRAVADRVGDRCRCRRAGGARPAPGGAARPAGCVRRARCVLHDSHLRQGLVLPHAVGMVDDGTRRRCRDLDRRRRGGAAVGRRAAPSRSGGRGRARRGRRRDVDDTGRAGSDGRRPGGAPVASAGSGRRRDGRRARAGCWWSVRARWHVRRGVERRSLVRFAGIRTGERTRTARLRCRRSEPVAGADHAAARRRHRGRRRGDPVRHGRLPRRVAQRAACDRGRHVRAAVGGAVGGVRTAPHGVVGRSRRAADRRRPVRRARRRRSTSTCSACRPIRRCRSTCSAPSTGC